MAPTSCFNGQVHRLPDAPEAYGAMITRAKAAPGQSRYADLVAIRRPIRLLSRLPKPRFFSNYSTESFRGLQYVLTQFR